MCHEASTWERDAVSQHTWGGDAGPAQGSLHSRALQEQCLPAAAQALIEQLARRGEEGMEKAFGVQVPLPESRTGRSTPEMPG